MQFKGLNGIPILYYKGFVIILGPLSLCKHN